MITILAIAAILFAGYKIYSSLWWSYYRKEFADFAIASLRTLLFSGLIVAIAFGSLEFVTDEWFPCYEVAREHCKQDIYSLKQNQQISGDFFLGSGGVGSSEYYYMFTKNDRGGFERTALLSSRCGIYQDENNRPTIKWDRVTYQYPLWLTIFHKRFWLDSQYELHVPANTIIQSFSVE